MLVVGDTYQQRSFARTIRLPTVEIAVLVLGGRRWRFIVETVRRRAPVRRPKSWRRGAAAGSGVRSQHECPGAVLRNRPRFGDSRSVTMDRYLLSLLVLALGGCGGNAAPNDGGAGFATRVDSRKALGMLSTFEQMQLCNDIVSYTTSTLLPGICRRAALTITASTAQSDTGLPDGDLQQFCSSQYSSCLASSVGTGVDAQGADAGAMGGVQCDLSHLQPTCSATVADYTACLTDLDAVDRPLPSCGVATRALLIDLTSDGGFSVARPPSCTPVDECTVGDGGQ